MSCDGPDCEDALKKLHLFIDHEMDDASCEEIQEHLDDCSDCLTEYDVERVVKKIVSRSCSEVAPDVLRAKVITSIRSVRVTVERHDSP